MLLTAISRLRTEVDPLTDLGAWCGEHAPIIGGLFVGLSVIVELPNSWDLALGRVRVKPFKGGLGGMEVGIVGVIVSHGGRMMVVSGREGVRVKSVTAMSVG